MSRYFALPHPWAFFDRQGGQGMARQTLGDTLIDMEAGGALYIAVPEGRTVKASGRKRGLEREGCLFSTIGGKFLLMSSSVGTRADEDHIDVSEGDAPVGSIRLVGHLPRPGWTAGKEGGAPPNPRAEAIDRFLLDSIARIRSADDDHGLASYPTHWERLAEAWAGDVADSPDPPREVIVVHAENLRGLIADIVSHKRRILRRTREQMPLGRVQQLDTTCIRWLSRQPGDDVFERAGPRQRILAVARYEAVDTLENRVLRSYVELARDVAKEYCRTYQRLNTSKRWKLVERYGVECRRLGQELSDEGIGKPEPPVTPNFVLQHDARYRRVWTAWQELRRRLDEQDESWRWQHRTWADFCRLAVHVALRKYPGVQTMAESPLRVAHSQLRGRWSMVDGQTGLFLAKTNGRDFALSVIGDLAVGHAKIQPWASAIGASCVVHVQALDNGKEAVIAVWPIHYAGKVRPSLASLVNSAGRALVECLDRFGEIDERPVAGGLVLLSQIEQQDEQNPEFDKESNVFGLVLGPESKVLTNVLSKIGKGILYRVDRLTA